MKIPYKWKSDLANIIIQYIKEKKHTGFKFESHEYIFVILTHFIIIMATTVSTLQNQCSINSFLMKKKDRLLITIRKLS